MKKEAGEVTQQLGALDALVGDLGMVPTHRGPNVLELEGRTSMPTIWSIEDGTQDVMHPRRAPC